MPKVGWSESFETGNITIDHQHRELFAGISGLDADMAAEAFEAANTRCRALRNLLWAHFDYEEKLLRDSRFPRAAQHARTHESGRRKIENILALFRENCRDGAKFACTTHWLTTLFDDVLMPDMDFKSHLDYRNLRR